MIEFHAGQLRSFWLHSHHLDTRYDKTETLAIAGACGLQNTPPGAWETSLYNRISGCSLPALEQMLYQDKSLVQAWSFRGAPVVFPTGEHDAFLSALIPGEGEPWIYTRGITLALDFLQLSFHQVLEMLKQVLPRLDQQVIESKTALDQTLADWMLPLLPPSKRDLWNAPSMYGSPDKQTVGGAAVSFLLRPCACYGLVVFGQRSGTSPSFTSWNHWINEPFVSSPDAAKKLVRKYLHCYGPATAASFENWLGCSSAQAKRMWALVSEEMEPVTVTGKKAFILSCDKDLLLSPAPIERELVLLGGHDPYLDQRNRAILLPDLSLHRQVWKMVSNPGVILQNGEIIGIWTNKKNGKGMDVTLTLWDGAFPQKQKLLHLVEEYAAFRQQPLMKVT